MSSSHLSGRNNSASIPKRSGRRCIAYTLKATGLPLGMRTGEWPSGPPPVGSTVVFVAIRILTGTDGYSRRASLKVSIIFDRNYWDCNALSLRTFCKYCIFLRLSRFNFEFASQIDEISLRNFFITFGWRTSRKLVILGRAQSHREAQLTMSRKECRPSYLFQRPTG